MNMSTYLKWQILIVNPSLIEKNEKTHIHIYHIPI